MCTGQTKSRLVIVLDKTNDSGVKLQEFQRRVPWGANADSDADRWLKELDLIYQNYNQKHGLARNAINTININQNDWQDHEVVTVRIWQWLWQTREDKYCEGTDDEVVKAEDNR